ncbi:MAG: ROK family protein [Chloroflexia bacterium]|nr:ROK family protein [Chloroflexia bacterium]
MDQADALVVAVDLGGTQIRGALSDLQGHFLKRMACATEAEQGREAVLDRLVDLIQQVRAPAGTRPCLGVGIGSPGPVDPKSGTILSPPNLPGWHHVPLRGILEERLGMPVRMANDGNVAVLGEWAFGAGQNCQNLLYVTISTGVGGGIISDGRLILGRQGLAGEVGHMTLKPDGPRCNCGNYGCWEALSSGTAIAREGAAAVREGRSEILAELCQGQPEQLAAKHVGQAAEQGEQVAAAIIRQAAVYAGIGVANLLHLFSPELVLIGGGVSNMGEMFLGPLRQTAQERLMPAYQDVPIRRAALGADVGLQGAVALFLLTEEAAWKGSL